MTLLRKSFLWILLLGSVGFWVYADYIRPGVCESPIRYSLGSFDERFRIPQANFKEAVDEATYLWENATGKNLFEYESDPKPTGSFYQYVGRHFVRAPIPVSLVYDERQQISEERRSLVSEVNEQKESVDGLKDRYLAKREVYRQASAEYLNLINEYKKKKTSYATVESKRLEVNRLADEVNTLIKHYNALVGEVNAVVQTINTTSGYEFEEGQYVVDAEGEKIAIYEFDDTQTLVRVLAHEFGHALGLDHNDNPDSLMYYLNDSKNMEPTKEDLADLALICKGE